MHKIHLYRTELLFSIGLIILGFFFGKVLQNFLDTPTSFIIKKEKRLVDFNRLIAMPQLQATPYDKLQTSIKNKIPAIHYQLHHYKTEKNQRWIKVNHKKIYEGDKIEGIKLVAITPEFSVFDFKGYIFRLDDSYLTN